MAELMSKATGLFRHLAFAILLVAALMVGSVWAVPWLVSRQAQTWVAENLPNKQLRMKNVSFNPLKLALVIDGMSIGDKGAKPMATVERMDFDLSSSSLLLMRPQFDAVEIGQPAIEAVLRRDGTLNLAELVPANDDTGLSEIQVDRLKIAGGRATITDHRDGSPKTKRIQPISFTLSDFSTRAGRGGSFSLNANTTQGEKISWAGKVALTPISSQGTFAVNALKLKTIADLAGGMLPLAVESGAISFAGDYAIAFTADPKAKPRVDGRLRSFLMSDAEVATQAGDRLTVKQFSFDPTRFSLAADELSFGAMRAAGISMLTAAGQSARIAKATLDPTRLALSTGTAQIGRFTASTISAGTAQKGPDNSTLLARLVVEPTIVALNQRKIEAGLVAAQGLRMSAHVGDDGNIRIPGLYPLGRTGIAAKSDAAPWQIALAGLTLRDGSAKLTITPQKGGGQVPSRTYDLSPMSIELGPLTTDLSAPLRVNVTTGINRAAKLAANGVVDVRAGNADLTIDASGLPLVPLASLMPFPKRLSVKSGTAGSKGLLQVRSALSNPQTSFAGDVYLVDFRLGHHDQEGDQELVSWKRMDMRGLRFASAPQRIDIRELIFDRPISRVLVTRSSRINVVSAAGMEQPIASKAPIESSETEGQDFPAQTAKALPEQAAVAPIEASSQTGTADPAETTVPDQLAGLQNSRAVSVAAPITGGISRTGALMPVSIGAVRFRNGVISLTDLSVEPNFAARIEGLNGAITGMSTDAGSQAEFNLAGFVTDKFSQVTITGKANPFAYDENTDIAVKFSNIELPIFNPYSGKWAGYAISKGKLTTEIHYRIVQRNLDADHRLVIDQLTWGKATESKERVSLPIRLATSLLKDGNGVIDLDLPVRGSLDDPKFSMWPLVWKVVGNVVTNIITAPFRLIGSLFKGADKAQYVSFAGGSSILSPEDVANLTSLAQGLKERGEVNLIIPAGGAGPQEDAFRLAEAKMRLSALATRKKQDETGYEALEPDNQVDLLEALYREKNGKKPQYPKESVESAGWFAGSEAKQSAARSRINWLENELRPQFAPSEAEMAALGQARADAVKAALLDPATGLAPERVFIDTSKAAAAKDGKIVLEIGVK